MRILIVTPGGAGAASGNAVTARRWQWLLGDLGHEALLRFGHALPERDAAPDLVIALHARKSAGAVEAAKAQGLPVVLAMTGTDLYADLPDSPEACRSVALADRIVVLQDAAIERLPAAARPKSHVIRQSVPASPGRREVDGSHFGVCVLAHLRPVKDPLCAARAAARLPADSRISVTLAGRSLDAVCGQEAVAEQARNPRFRWVGELIPPAAAALLAGSQLMVQSSLAEGGANVVSEAVVRGVPILATRIDGNRGLLGADYPGYFPPGDDAELAGLLLRAEREPGFLAELEAAVTALQPRFDPAQESAAWGELLAGLGV